MRRNPLPVTSAGHVLHPLLVLKIPANGFANSGFKRFLRPPTQFAFNLPRIHGIAPVVSRAVLHEGDQFASRPSRPRRHFIHDIANRVHDLQVGLLIPTADVVGLSRNSPRQHQCDRRAMVRHINPVPHILPVAVHRKRLALARSQSYAGATSPETETFHNYWSNWS